MTNRITLLFSLTLCILTVFRLSSLTADTVSNASRVNDQWTQEKAITRIGITQTNGGHLVSAQLEQISSGDFPNGFRTRVGLQQVLRVVYDSVRIWDNPSRTYTLIVIIDPYSGNVIQATATRSAGTSVEDSESALGHEELRLLNRGFCYAGLPDSQYTSFVKVIRGCPMNAPSANRITAVYSLDSCAESHQVVPRWFVALTGTRPHPMVGVRGVPDSVLNNGPTAFWVIMDGRSGAPLEAGNM